MSGRAGVTVEARVERRLARERDAARERIRALAKVHAAEGFRAGGPRVTDQVARLAYGTLARPLASISALVKEGLVEWDVTHARFRCTPAGVAELERQP